MNYIETIIVSCIVALSICVTVSAAHSIKRDLEAQLHPAVEIIEGLPEILDQSRHPLNVSDMYKQLFETP